jgi:rod shape determining protein RodA
MEFNKRYLRSIDWVIIVLLLCLAFFSFVGISGATPNTNEEWKQMFFYGMGFIVLFGVLLFDYNTLSNFAYPLYAIGIVLLIGVLFTDAQYGAHSWYRIKVINLNFQPSELMKLIVIMTVAKYLSDKSERDESFETFKDLLPVLLLVGVPLLLILIQPDLGTALVYIAILVSMLFVAGLHKRFYIILGTAVAGFFGILTFLYFFANNIFFKIVRPHQWSRIESWWHPENYPEDGYHLLQSLTAVGSGQLFGKGIGEGTQARFGWVPFGENDFIFTVIAEEMGFVGSSLLILVFFFLLYRMVRIAMNAKDMYGMYLVTGVIGMFVFQIFENIGMTIQLMPITGITLPFVSAGGSSLLTNFLIMGMVLNVGMRHKKLTFE